MPNKGIRRIEFKVWELPRPYHYLIAIGSSLAMFALHGLVSPWIGDKSAFAFFGYAVGLSAFCGGFFPGVVATFLSLGLGWFFFADPNSSFQIADRGTLVSMIFAAGMWLFICLLCHLLRETAFRFKEAAIERDINRDRLLGLFNSMSDPFYTLDRNLNMTFANPTFLRATQTSLEAIQGRHLLDVFPGAALIHLDKHFSTAMANNEAFTSDIQSPESEHWYHVRAFPDDNGISVYLQDVTLRKTIEARTSALLEEERNARTNSERASRLKDEFVATLSHELRTPLTSILGWAELLHSRASDEKTREGLGAIVRSTRSQAKLIEELLDMNRIASGKVLLEFEFAPLDEIVVEVVETLRNTLEAKKLHLEVVYTPEPVVVRVDPSRMQQVVSNLLENAIKFTHAGGKIRMEIGIWVREDGREFAELIVQDNGVGIEPEFLPSIFDRFRQANSSISRRYGGLGLGLAIVKQLIDLQEGEVIAESEGLSKGSRFTVRLPLVAFSLPQQLPVLKSGQGLAPDQDLGHLKILVVEDDEPSRDVIRMMLTESGAKVVAVGSAHEALEWLGKNRPDVMVCDIGMPDVDGYTLIKQIRCSEPNHSKSMPAVALTAFVSSSDRAAAMEAGFNAHVDKPIELLHLKTAILEVTEPRAVSRR